MNYKDNSDEVESRNSQEMQHKKKQEAWLEKWRKNWNRRFNNHVFVYLYLYLYHYIFFPLCTPATPYTYNNPKIQSWLNHKGNVNIFQKADVTITLLIDPN